MHVSDDYISSLLTLNRGTLERIHYLMYVLKIKEDASADFDRGDPASSRPFIQCIDWQGCIFRKFFNTCVSFSQLLSPPYTNLAAASNNSNVSGNIVFYAYIFSCTMLNKSSSIN